MKWKKNLLANQFRWKKTNNETLNGFTVCEKRTESTHRKQMILFILFLFQVKIYFEGCRYSNLFHLYLCVCVLLLLFFSFIKLRILSICNKASSRILLTSKLKLNELREKKFKIDFHFDPSSESNKITIIYFLFFFFLKTNKKLERRNKWNKNRLNHPGN